MKRIKAQRSARGNALALTLALTIGIGWVILYFGWQYTKQLSSYQEQKTAIDAAADAAGKDLSRIVVEDPNVGFVSLSDYAPTGKSTGTGVAKYTIAGDGYPVSVKGINTLLATARLDMIMADLMQDPVMQQLAIIDYNNAISAQSRLVNVLQQIIPPGGTYNPSGIVGYDVDGNIVNPVQDALNAYIANQIRIAGKPSLLVPNSLKLSLGFVPSALTSRAPLPQPLSSSNVPSNQQSNGYYLPNVQILYNSKSPIVFAALGTDTTLVDFKTFVTNIGLNSAVPTVVKCEADQRYYDTDAYGAQVQHTIHTVSAAEASCILDQRPDPGALTVTMTGGIIPDIQVFGDLFNNYQLLAAPTDSLQSPTGGDYPQTALTPFSFATNNPFPAGIDPTHPPFTYLFSVAYYNWVRRMGMNANLSQLTTNLLSVSMVPNTNTPTVFSFSIDSSGNLVQTQTAAQNKNLCVSQNQWRATSGLGLTDANGVGYDLQITDFTYQPSRSGGLHWGEPLDNPGATGFNAAGKSYSGSTMFENPTWPYQEYLSGGGSVRPSYTTNGVAADFTFRKRQ